MLRRLMYAGTDGLDPTLTGGALSFGLRVRGRATSCLRSSVLPARAFAGIFQDNAAFF